MVVGLNWMMKDVKPPIGTKLAGCFVMVKSPASGPLIETVPSIKGAMTLLAIWTVISDVLPTAVFWNPVPIAGLVDPLTTSWPPAVTNNSGRSVKPSPWMPKVNGLGWLGSFSVKLIRRGVQEACRCRLELDNEGREAMSRHRTGRLLRDQKVLAASGPPMETVPSVKAVMPAIGDRVGHTQRTARQAFQ